MKMMEVMRRVDGLEKRLKDLDDVVKEIFQGFVLLSERLDEVEKGLKAISIKKKK